MIVREMALGGKTLKVIEIAREPERRFRVELDGERRRVRVRKTLFDVGARRPGSHDWIEGDDGDLALLVECLESERTTRRGNEARVVLESQWNGLSGANTTTTVTVTVARGGVIEVDMKDRINEVDPNVGW
jgi:hypothetical protein